MNDISARVPVNSTAAKVTSRSAEEYKPNKKIQNNDSPYPLETRPVGEKEDMTGVRFGRFIVVGLSTIRTTNGNHWVVKCSCGTYTTRKKKAITNPRNSGDRCEHCRHLAFIKKRDLWLRTGIDRSVDDF